MEECWSEDGDFDRKDSVSDADEFEGCKEAALAAINYALDNLIQKRQDKKQKNYSLVDGEFKEQYFQQDIVPCFYKENLLNVLWEQKVLKLQFRVCRTTIPIVW